MFETSLVESSGALRSKSSRYMWVTGAFNAAVVAGMILVPLLFPEALPQTAMVAMLSAPPPPPSAPPVPARATTAKAVAAASLDPLVAPTKPPHAIDMRDDPPAIPNAAIAGMVGPSTVGAGVMDAMGIGAAPPVTVVKPSVPKSVGPARVSSGVMAGQILNKTQPVYPAIARAAHVSGAVVLHAVISKTGTIESLSVVSGPEMLRSSAVAAVQEWRYKPYLLNGESTEVETTITVNFSFGG